MKSFVLRFIFTAILVTATGLEAQPEPPAKPEKVADGIIVPVGGNFLKVEVWGPNVIRVVTAKHPIFFTNSTPATEVRQRVKTNWKLETRGHVAMVSTPALQVHLDLWTRAVSFFDSKGEKILSERTDGRRIRPAQVQGENTFHVEQQWDANEDESLYGMGQLQFGTVDIKGYDLDLWQHNTCVVVPLLVSSRGYGIYWDNLSATRFGDLRPWEAVPASCMVDATGQAGGWTTGTFSTNAPDQLQNPHVTSDVTAGGGRGRRGAGWTRWSGEIVPTNTGDYQFRTYSNGGIKMWLDGKLVINHWRQNWLTENDQIKVHLEEGHHYAIRLEHGGDQATTVQLSWKTPVPGVWTGDRTTLWSEVGDGVDYYFIYGPAMDKVIAGYRQITGQAAMMPEWAFGLWQSRNRYETAQQSIDVVKGFRQRGIPFDNIVQDWMYWRDDAWGSHQFDPARFPDPAGWIKSLHDLHAHVMISVWGKFYPGTSNFNALQSAGYLYQPDLIEGVLDWINHPYTFYDAFNPGARKMYWSQINTALFSKGIDAWWEDATEPDVTASPPTLENSRAHIGTTAMGKASRVMNAYALMNSMGMYEGQRSVAPDQRVFILTRSGFGGIQRYGTATWSGDTTSKWSGMAKQIAAGLGYCISGTPYWTMDIGGYTMESRFSAQNPTPEAADEWRELNARWFEFGAFCPFTRPHGELKNREPWEFGGDDSPAGRAIVKFDKLRYRLLPYIYSLAGAVAKDGGTMMRPLVMDFPQDKAAREIADQYMFGPAFMVAPVTSYQARSRTVHLPETKGGWYDFWSGAAMTGGRTFDAPAPYDAMPLFIRAGSIIPFGPEIQYTGEKSTDPLTLYIYAGANGSFSLYEDDGLTYDCDKGAFARISFQWDDARRTLTIGAREGKFPGMLEKRTFNVVLIAKGKATGYSPTPTPDKTETYSGKAVKVKFD